MVLSCLRQRSCFLAVSLGVSSRTSIDLSDDSRLRHCLRHRARHFSTPLLPRVHDSSQSPVVPAAPAVSSQSSPPRFSPVRFSSLHRRCHRFHPRPRPRPQHVQTCQSSSATYQDVSTTGSDNPPPPATLFPIVLESDKTTTMTAAHALASQQSQLSPRSSFSSSWLFAGQGAGLARYLLASRSRQYRIRLRAASSATATSLLSGIIRHWNPRLPPVSLLVADRSSTLR